MRLEVGEIVPKRRKNKKAKHAKKKAKKMPSFITCKVYQNKDERAENLDFVDLVLEYMLDIIMKLNDWVKPNF